MGDRLGNLSGCTQVRTKVCRKDYDWYLGLVYDPTGLPGVTTARPGVVGVLQCSYTLFGPQPCHLHLDQAMQRSSSK
jgi:hypothetical protein